MSGTMRCTVIAAFLFLATPIDATGSKAGLNMMANPVRKVVAMLQRMQKQITTEGEKKEAMFEKFMCYCDGGDKQLAASIAAAEDKIPQIESAIKEKTGSKAQLEADVAQGKKDRAESSSALAKAKAIREKEQKEFSAEAANTKSNADALKKAVAAVEQGAGAAFIQTNLGLTEKLRQLSVSMDMEAVDRDLLANFLADGSNSRGSGEVLGILKTMEGEMNTDLADSSANEEASGKAYESLVSAKKKEKAALTKAIETKTVRVGQLAVDLAAHENDLEDTKENLAEDKNMYAHLAKNCATKKKEWEEYKKNEATELVALADTIKLLNDDDALDLFKKALPSAASSFMQVQVTSKSMQRRALQMLKSARRGHGHSDPRLDFLEIALHGGQMGFDKVLKMVDNLMTVLKKEQGEDDSKKSYCLAELDKNEDAKKALAVDISDLGKAIEDGEESMKVLSKEIAALTQGIKDLDRSVGEATEARKKENAEVTETLSTNTAAKELLSMAKNRLNKFYNPDQYKAAPKRQLSDAEAITLNMGGTLAPTAAPGGVAGTDIGAASFMQVQAKVGHRQPAADLSFEKRGEESQGVLTMIGMLISDVEKNSEMLELEEKEAQAEYETFMADAKKKRSLDAKAVTDKESAKAKVEGAFEQNKLALKDKKTEMVETNEFIVGLHSECDWLLKYYDTRKQARSEELESLDKAKAVLNGADYSFIQTGSVRLRGSQ